MSVNGQETPVEVDHLEELKQLLAQARHPKTIELLNKGIGLASTPRTVAAPVRTSARAHSDRPSAVPVVKLSSYGWDQSDKFVKIYITDVPEVNQLKSENIKTNFTERSMEVELIGKKNYTLIINDLLMPIDPKKSSAKIHSGNVVVSLRKTSAQNWSCLLGKEKKIKDAREETTKPNPDEDPGAGIMKMMQKMYDEGDDDMKRTIKKAWFESQEKRNKEGDAF